MTLVVPERRAADKRFTLVGDPRFAISPRELAISAIRRDAGCRKWLAEGVYDMLEDMLEQARATGYQPVRMTRYQLWSPTYDVFKQVIPHDEMPRPGSAHEAIEQALLDPERNEHGIRHRQLDTERLRLHCVVSVSSEILQQRGALP